LALAGIVVGILISLAARAAIDHRSTLRVVITGYWILTTTIIAMVGAILGAVYPAVTRWRRKIRLRRWLTNEEGFQPRRGVFPGS